MNKNLSLIGFFQAMGIVVFVVLIAGFFQLMAKISIQLPVFIVSVIMLIILVFSVAVVGLIVFGYPAYLALNKRFKEGLTLVGFTLLYTLGFIIIAIVLMTVLT